MTEQTELIVKHLINTMGTCVLKMVILFLWYLLTCPYFANEREECLKKYYYRRPNIMKYRNLLTCNNKTTLTKLFKLIRTIIEHFN